MSKIILILFFYPLEQKKEHVPDTEVSFMSGSVRYTGPKTFADEKLPSISEKFMISYRRAAIEKKLPQNVFNGQ